MKNDENPEKRIQQILNSADKLRRASPKPYLLTRINARLANPAKNGWETMAAFISRPVVMAAGLCLLLTVNISVLITKNVFPASQSSDRAFVNTGDDDEDYNSLANIDNIENQ